jgi:hypothetical protein
VADLDWDACSSIPPRRQGRRAWAFDFAQWHLRVVVYDQYGWEEHPMYPAGEFYGEFGLLVRLTWRRIRSSAPPACPSAATRAGPAPPGSPAAHRLPARLLR